LFSAKWLFSVKWTFGQTAFGQMAIRSNGHSVKWCSVKRCSVKLCFGQMAFGQKNSIKWLFGKVIQNPAFSIELKPSYSSLLRPWRLFYLNLLFYFCCIWYFTSTVFHSHHQKSTLYPNEECFKAKNVRTIHDSFLS
jgi:hypothetical protein